MQSTDDFPWLTEAQRLNQHCLCKTLDQAEVLRHLSRQLGDDTDLMPPSPVWQQFFSNTAVFIPGPDLARMQAIVKAIEKAAALPDYQRLVLSRVPCNTHFRPGPRGALMGYDFHLGKEGPALIEVNTNAGGAFLNAVLARAQLRCCGGSAGAAWAEDFEGAVISQFESEWRTQRNTRRPESIAIVDDQPTQQYLYPEFKLAQHLFQAHGIDALILSPSDIEYKSGTLYNGNKRIDLVYNRLVDFGLEAPEHAPLRSAWLDGGAVITPNPFVHALLADKRNLALLSDHEALLAWGLGDEDVNVLRQGIPHTVAVNAAAGEKLWEQRKQWFFKPVAGHGSKGVYRGSKLTRSTFARILDDNYIAQTYVPASERLVLVDGEQKMLKVDVRLYTYRGNPILAAARLYRGQTTNFRTPGGGFAPLLVMQD